MSKNNIIWLVILTAGVALVGIYFWIPDAQQASSISSITDVPSITPEASPSPSSRPNITKVPVSFPTGNGKTSFVGESVPWSLLLVDASCELKGELKFLNHNTYDNQDALFSYNGIDSPGRNILWTITPQDNISVGPNIFSNIPIPDGESLLGVSLPENPKSRTYDITAKIQYGRLVDTNGKFVTAGGTVKMFEKQCKGKTTIVLP